MGREGYGAGMESLQQTIEWLNSVLSDYVLTVLLIGCGVFFSIRTRFVQFRCFGEGIRNALGKNSGERQHQDAGISPFQSLMAAVAAQVGTGNIVGASGAILVGGPGAIFWMWIIASFGMATIYSEAVLAQKTRVVLPDGTVEGGPVYYIRKAFPGRLGGFLAGFFAVAIIISLGCVGCMVQVNSISATCQTAFGIPAWVTGAAHATGDTYRDMIASSGLTQTDLMQYAVASVSSNFIGDAFVAVCLFFFAFSSVIVWNLFGKFNCNYLFGKRSTLIYSVVALAFIFFGTLMKSDLVWALQDLLNQLMVLPNAAALIALSGTVAAAARRK